MVIVDYIDLEKYLSYSEGKSERWEKFIGSKVRNDTFGLGTICEVKINGKNVYFAIAFSNGLQKVYTPKSFIDGFLKELTITDSLEVEVQEHYSKGLLLASIESQKAEQNYRQLLNKYRIKSLWYMSHIKNLSSILKIGICSRYLIQYNKIDTVDISDARVQRRRSSLHSYVNLYFADNTPMLYVCVRDYGNQIILLELDPYNVLNKNIVITDGNAAASETQRYDTLEAGLKALDIDAIISRSYDGEKKREKMAEVLVNDPIDSCNIKRIHVQTADAKKSVKLILNRIDKSEIDVVLGLSREGVDIA